LRARRRDYNGHAAQSGGAVAADDDTSAEKDDSSSTKQNSKKKSESGLPCFGQARSSLLQMLKERIVGGDVGAVGVKQEKRGGSLISVPLVNK